MATDCGSCIVFSMRRWREVSRRRLSNVTSVWFALAAHRGVSALIRNAEGMALEVDGCLMKPQQRNRFSVRMDSARDLGIGDDKSCRWSKHCMPPSQRKTGGTTSPMPQHEPGEALSALSDSLPALEEAFAPLLQRPWSETLESMSELDRAKVDILMAYAINDLVWSESTRPPTSK